MGITADEGPGKEHQEEVAQTGTVYLLHQELLSTIFLEGFLGASGLTWPFPVSASPQVWFKLTVVVP